MTMRLAHVISALGLALLLMGCGLKTAASDKPPAPVVTAAAATMPAATLPAATAPAANPNAVAAPDPANAVETARLVNEPTRRVVKLANGLTVILQENHTAPVVAAKVFIKAGSLTEQEYMGTGISHVLEHLVAGASSAKRKESESKELLRTIGNDSNAYTTFDRTVYFITTTGEKWPMAMDLLSDWVTNAAFTEEEFQREYQVVQREIEMGEAEAGRTFSKLTYANRYLVHPAKHPVIGYKPAFQRLTREDCQKYYNRMYVPDNMIVTVAGDISLDAAQKLIAEKFSHVSRKKVPAISLPDEPAVAAPRTRIGHADVRLARVEWAFPTVTVFSDDMYPLDVLANILGQGDSSPLVAQLRDEKQLVSSIVAFSSTPEFGPGEFAVVAELPPEKVLTARREVLSLLQNVLDKGVDPQQLEKAKAQMAASLVYENQTADQQASKNGSDYLTTGNIDFSRVYFDRIQAVTAAQVQAAARQYLRPETLLTTVLLPKKTPDSVVNESVAATEAAAKLPVKKFTLPNGITVLIRRNTAAPLVAMNYYVMGGLLAENDATNGVGTAMMQLMERGAGNLSQPQIADFFDRTGGSLSCASGNNTFGVNATCLKANAEKTFNVFADVCLQPTFPQEELERLRPQLLAAVEHSTEDWFGESYTLLRKTYFAESPYKRMPVGKAEVIGKLTREQVQQHFNTYFQNTGHAVLAIYGDVDPEQAAAWAQRFAAVPRKEAPLALRSTGTGPKTVQQHTDKRSAAVFLGFGPGMTVTDNDRYAATVLKTILGGYSYPGGWIFDTLRGKGLVYVAQVTNITGPAKGMMMVAALGEPQNSEKILAVINEKIANAKAGKFTDEEIRTAKDQAITGELLSDPTIAAQATTQALDELMGLGYDARTHFAERIKAVTRDDLVRVANQYFQNPVVAISSPAVPETAPAK